MKTLVSRIAAKYTRMKTGGGSTFEVFIREVNPTKAFAEAVQNARHESGHGGYSGTIAEKGSFKIRHNDAMAKQEAQRFIEDDMDKNDKWGPAFAVPIGESTQGPSKEFKLDVRARTKYDAESLVKQQLEAKAKPGTTVVVEIPYNGIQQSKEGGKSEYEVVKLGGTKYQVGASYYNDKKTAIEAAKRYLDTQQPGESVTIREITEVAKITKQSDPKRLPAWTVTGKATVHKKSTKILGWMFYGWASS